MKKLILILLIFSLQAWSQDKEQEIRQKAKKRLYVGGKDEQDIKVQPQLVEPIRKFKPPKSDEPIIETPSEE